MGFQPKCIFELCVRSPAHRASILGTGGQRQSRERMTSARISKTWRRTIWDLHSDHRDDKGGAMPSTVSVRDRGRRHDNGVLLTIDSCWQVSRMLIVAPSLLFMWSFMQVSCFRNSKVIRLRRHDGVNGRHFFIDPNSALMRCLHTSTALSMVLS